MSLNIEESYNCILNVLKEQIQMYEQICEIGKQQKIAISESNEVQFNELMNAKNDLMVKLGDLNAKMNEAKEYWDQNFESAPNEWRENIKSNVGQISNLIQSVIGLDDEIKNEMEGLIEQRNSQNKKKANIRKLKSAYGNGPSKDNFIDKSQ